MDVMTGWTRSDRLALDGPTSFGAALAKGFAADFDAALALANGRVRVDYVAGGSAGGLAGRQLSQRMARRAVAAAGAPGRASREWC